METQILKYTINIIKNFIKELQSILDVARENREVKAQLVKNIQIIVSKQEKKWGRNKTKNNKRHIWDLINISNFYLRS